MVLQKRACQTNVKPMSFLFLFRYNQQFSKNQTGLNLGNFESSTVVAFPPHPPLGFKPCLHHPITKESPEKKMRNGKYHYGSTAPTTTTVTTICRE